MANLVTVIKKTWYFVSVKLWHIRIDKVDKTQGFFLRQLRIFSLAINGFNEDKCLTKATALTFYTLFSIVPILALAFAISKGFGLEKNLQEMISGNYPEYKEVLDQAFVSAGKLLSTAKGGVIAGFGIVLLLWSVLKLLVSIEDNFNETDFLFMSAAVADARVRTIAQEKIKKGNLSSIELAENPDRLAQTLQDLESAKDQAGLRIGPGRVGGVDDPPVVRRA